MNDNVLFGVLICPLAEYAETVGKPLIIVACRGGYAVCPMDTGGVVEQFSNHGACTAALRAAGYKMTERHHWTKVLA
jgi:hypothetical protein